MKILWWQRIASHHPYWRVSQQRNRLEIVQDVVRKVHGCAEHDVRIPMPDADGVAIGRCACDPPNANAAATARYVFYDDWLAEQVLM